MIWCCKGYLDNNKMVPLNIQWYSLKKSKIILIPWAFTLFPLANFIVALVGTNREKRDMKFVTETFDPLYL